MANVVHIGGGPPGSAQNVVRGAVYHLNSDVHGENPMTAGGPAPGGPPGSFLFSYFDGSGVLCHDSLHSSMVTPAEWRVALAIVGGHRQAESPPET